MRLVEILWRNPNPLDVTVALIGTICPVLEKQNYRRDAYGSAENALNNRKSNFIRRN